MSPIRFAEDAVGPRVSYALLSSAMDVDTAVVFVHGFGGSPTGTWADFHSLVDKFPGDYPWWSSSDLFFFGYESIHAQIRRNAPNLGDFVERV